MLRHIAKTTPSESSCSGRLIAECHSQSMSPSSYMVDVLSCVIDLCLRYSSLCLSLVPFPSPLYPVNSPSPLSLSSPCPPPSRFLFHLQVRNIQPTLTSHDLGAAGTSSFTGTHSRSIASRSLPGRYPPRITVVSVFRRFVVVFVEFNEKCCCISC